MRCLNLKVLMGFACAASLGSFALAQQPQHLDLIVASRAYGTLLAINPTDGTIRAVLTGPDLRTPAKTIRGTGTPLSGALSGDIACSRNATVYWKLATTSTTFATYRIDPATGNRSGLFGSAGSLHDSSGSPIPLDAQTLLLAADGFNGGTNANSRILRFKLPAGPTTLVSGDLVGDGVRMFRGRSMVLADNRTAFVAEIGNFGGPANSSGLYRVDLQSGARQLVSRLLVQPLSRSTVIGGVQSPSPFTWTRGTGPVANGQVRSLLLAGGKLYAGVSSNVAGVFYSGILEIDISTGDRALIVGTAVLDDGIGLTVVTNPASNAGAPAFDSPSGLTLLSDGTIAFTSLFTYNTINRFNPVTRELTVLADLGPQVTSDVRGNMQLTSMTRYTSCGADLNLDGVVDDADFSFFAAAYNVLDCADPGIAPPCAADLTGDLVVDDHDFVAFVPAYDRLLCD
jgi:hypothetical protein